MLRRVLVIDDEPSIRMLVAGVLADDGWIVAEASNGLEALHCIERQRFDAIVLDLSMPVMDGRTFYARMLERGPAIPTLILSAYGAMGAAREIGAAAALQKPFDVDDLSRAVDALAPDVGAEAD